MDKKRLARQSTLQDIESSMRVTEAQSYDSPGQSLQKQNSLSTPDPKSKQQKIGQQIGATPKQRWFTKERMNETMARELFSWLGLLSAEKKG